MPSALVATIGAANANTYATLAEAETYFSDRLHTLDWLGAVADDKNAALLMAARRIDQTDFVGVRYTTVQSMAWPRINVRDEDGYAVAVSVIPVRVKQAQMEEALGLLRASQDPDQRDDLAGIRRVKVDVIEVEAVSGGSSAKTGLLASTTRLLRPFLRAGAGIVPMERG